MIDVLLINPNEHAHDIVRVLSTNNISYLIVTTNGNMFAYPKEMNVLNMNTESWVKEETFKIGLAWGLKSYLFLKGVTELGQVILKNNFSDKIDESYQITPFNTNDGRLYNIMSYKGVHVVTDAFAFINNKWATLKDHSTKFYTGGADIAYQFLDTNGILNGPSQVFVHPNGNVTTRLGYASLHSKVSKRNVIDGLVSVAGSNSLLESNFFNWTAKTGSSVTSFYLR